MKRDVADYVVFFNNMRSHRKLGMLTPRNPKLFDGQYCSLVHMQNGKYQIHMKTINASSITDRNQFAFNVYSELLTAFSIID